MSASDFPVVAAVALSRDDPYARRDQMFPKLSHDQLERLRSCGHERSAAAGELLFDQGQSDIPFFVVLSGSVEIVHPSRGADEPITVHEPGEFTGEVDLLSGRRSLVRGRARTASRLLVIERSRLRSLVQTDAELSELFLRAFILRRMGLVAHGQGDVVLVGSRHSSGTLRLQEFLTRSTHPFTYVDVETDAGVQDLLDTFHVAVDDVPVVICRGERVLKNPTNSELADCLGFNPTLDASALRDLVVVGSCGRRVRGLRGSRRPGARVRDSWGPSRVELQDRKLSRVPHGHFGRRPGRPCAHPSGKIRSRGRRRKGGRRISL
jgi:thioredoxin reductase (NADPH)